MLPECCYTILERTDKSMRSRPRLSLSLVAAVLMFSIRWQEVVGIRGCDQIRLRRMGLLFRRDRMAQRVVVQRDEIKLRGQRCWINR